MQSALLIGNSDGIGRAFTRALLAAGWRATGISRSDLPAAAAGVAASPTDADSPPAYVHTTLDVNDPGYPTLLERLWAERGPFDLVAHCAAVGRDLEVGPDGIERLPHDVPVLMTNLISLVRTIEVLLPAMLARKSGHLIGLSSIADCLPVPDAPSYVASKAGYSRYLQATAARLAGGPVAITNVRFGFVDTKLAQSPVKPMMVTPERAAAVLMRAVRRRPAQVTFPRTIGCLAAVWGAAAGVRTALRSRFAPRGR